MRRRCAVLILLILLLTQTVPVHAQDPIQVYYAGQTDRVWDALRLNEDFAFVSDPTKADVLVINGTIPQNPALKSAIEAGRGTIIFFGPSTAEEDLAWLISSPFHFEQAGDPLSLINVKGADHPALTQIIWTSAPQVRERAVVVQTDSLSPLVTGYDQNHPVFARVKDEKKNVFLFTAFLGEYNQSFEDWAYFNYFIYSITTHAGGGEPKSFGDYPASPVPHPREQAILLGILGTLIVIVALVFVLVRRYSLSHPEVLDQLISNPDRYIAREESTDWEQIGFHRPLGGFLVALMTGLVLFIPLILYQNLILPVFILPSAQALGIWGRVVQFFNFLWLLLDMGTSAAFIKFFAQYRIRDPRKAIQFVQVYIWWQALSGAFQVGAVTFVAGTLLPHSVYALYAWSILIHTLVQIPGFYQVFRHLLMGWQRFDYAQFLDLGLYLVFQILIQPIFVSLMVWWGRSHPAFGTAMGGLLGLGISAYMIEASAFILGFWLYRRLGLSTRVIFMAHFGWDTVKAAFKFGVFEMLGSIAWALGQAGEIVITQTRLVNYTEIWGNWGLAQNFIFSYQVLASLYSNLMPSLSEAVSHARRILAQYYAAVAYKWGGFISAFIGAVLLAVADRFILGASGVEFRRAALFAVPLVIWGAIQYPSWVADNVQLASNKPFLKAILVIGEQVIRLVLAFLLLERFQINALILAYFVGLLTKDIIGYAINHRLCFHQKFYFWQSLAAPLLAGGVHYVILRLVTGWIWRGDQITSVLIFLIGILISYPLYTFLYGLFGGWDDSTLEELHRAVYLSSFMKPFAWLFWKSTSIGARISPLHNRFPIEIHQAAMLEAESLTAERVHLLVEV